MTIYRGGSFLFDLPDGYQDVGSLMLFGPQADGFADNLVISHDPDAPASFDERVNAVKKEYRGAFASEAAFVGAGETTVAGEPARVIEIARPVADSPEPAITRLRHVVVLSHGTTPLTAVFTTVEERHAASRVTLDALLGSLNLDSRGNAVQGALGVSLPQGWREEGQARFRDRGEAGPERRALTVSRQRWADNLPALVAGLRGRQEHGTWRARLEAASELDTPFGRWVSWRGTLTVSGGEAPARRTSATVSLRPGKTAAPAKGKTNSTPTYQQGIVSAATLRDRWGVYVELVTSVNEDTAVLVHGQVLQSLRPAG